MPLNQHLRTLAIKAEDVAGTYNAPVDADFNVRCYGVEFTPALEQDEDTTKYATGDHGEDVAVSGAQVGTLTCSIKLPAGASATTEPNAWKFLKACGATGIEYTSTGVALVGRKAADATTYSICMRDQTIGASPTIVEYRLKGCMGNAVISAEGVGKPWIAQLTFNVVVDDIVDGSALTLTAPNSTNPEKLLSSTVSVLSESVQISSFSFDLGNVIQPVYDQSTAAGVAYYVITERRPRLSCNPLAKNQADWDVWGDAIANTTGVVSITSDNYTLKLPRAQMMPPALGNREGMVSWDLSFRALRNGYGSTEADATLTEEDTWELLQGARA